MNFGQAINGQTNNHRTGWLAALDLPIWFGIVLFRLLLDVIYVVYIKEIWQHHVYRFGVNFFDYILSWVFLLLFSVLLLFAVKQDRFSDKVLFFLFLFSFVPTTTIMAFAQVDLTFRLLMTTYWLVLILVHLMIPRKQFIIPKLNSELFLHLMVAGFALLIFYIWIFHAKGRFYLDLTKVYAIRNIASQYRIPTILRYLYAISRAVIPLLLTFCLCFRRRILAILLVLLQYLSFVSDGSKSTLFSLGASLVVYILYSDKIRIRVTFLSVLASVVSLGEVLLLTRSKIIDYGIRRVLFLTAMIHVWYYEFFATHAKDFFRQSFARVLGFQSPFSEPVPAIIGRLYYSDSYVNNGLFSDAYYNLGVLGIFVMPILIVLALRLLEGCAVDLPQRAYSAALITATWYLLGSSFFTVLLTHGYLTVCLILLGLQNFKLKDVRGN